MRTALTRVIKTNVKPLLFVVLLWVACLVALYISRCLARVLGISLSHWISVLVYFGVLVPEIIFIGRLIYLPWSRT